jgi:hypothetical protein
MARSFLGHASRVFFAALLNLTLSLLAGSARRRVRKRADLPNPEIVLVRLLLIAFVIRGTLSKLALPLRQPILGSHCKFDYDCGMRMAVPSCNRQGRGLHSPAPGGHRQNEG